MVERRSRSVALDLRVLDDARREDPGLLNEFDRCDEEFAQARREIVTWLAEEREQASEGKEREPDGWSEQKSDPARHHHGARLFLTARLARQSGLSAGQMRRILNGKGPITSYVARRLETFFHECGEELDLPHIHRRPKRRV
ncbi:hypothetical protein [Nisaea sediminum]|uniref:hypothetical protein n=1 Tax=Nisaea sediminum TaxID=2775867 RepID=UPI001866CE64|nr:hypothetical protein [Nisaea sediminum]